MTSHPIPTSHAIGKRKKSKTRRAAGPSRRKKPGDRIPPVPQTGQLSRQLARTNDQMDHLVRALSHDMNANFMMLELSFDHLKRGLANGATSELQQEATHVEACLRESKRLLDDLVTLARTGRVAMEPARVELASIVDEVVLEQAELIQRRKVAVEIAPKLPELWCNRGRVKQVVTNLVRNALRHGCADREGRITIARGASEWATDGQAAFVVWDNGPGIDPAARRAVFEPGHRLPEAHRDGTGMGLAIVQRICDYYRGRVLVDPARTEGTAIVVCLPRAETNG